MSTPRVRVESIGSYLKSLTDPRHPQPQAPVPRDCRLWWSAGATAQPASATGPSIRSIELRRSWCYPTGSRHTIAYATYSQPFNPKRFRSGSPQYPRGEGRWFDPSSGGYRRQDEPSVPRRSPRTGSAVHRQRLLVSACAIDHGLALGQAATYTSTGNYILSRSSLGSHGVTWELHALLR
jgi:hypothetical protein